MPAGGTSRATTINTYRLAELIGCSAQLIYRQLETHPEELPVQPITLGRRYRWPTIKVAQALGLTPEFVVNGCAHDLDAVSAGAASPEVDDGDVGDAA
jgi:hypothetical protein